MAHSLATGLWHKVTNSFNGRSGSEQTFTENNTPAVGDRYSQTARDGSVWVVQNVVSVASSRYPLVRLTRENHPDLMKIVSVSTLADQGEFRRAH